MANTFLLSGTGLFAAIFLRPLWQKESSTIWLQKGFSLLSLSRAML